MAEEPPVTESLSENIANAGAKLVAKLEAAQIPIEGALWMFVPELGKWRFFIASSKVPTEGPKFLYVRIQAVLASGTWDEPNLDIQDISVVDPDTPVIAAIRSMFQIGPEGEGSRIRGMTIAGSFIADSYIYRSREVSTTSQRAPQTKAGKAKKRRK